MADTSDFRNGLIIKFKSDLYTVVEFQHVKPVITSYSIHYTKLYEDPFLKRCQVTVRITENRVITPSRFREGVQ